MRKDFEPRLNRIGMELVTYSSLVEVGTRSEGGRYSVVVRFQVEGRVALLEEMEGICKLTSMNEVLQKTVNLKQFLDRIFWYGNFSLSVTSGHHELKNNC